MEGIQKKSILIKDTTKEEREKIIHQSLYVCGGACNFCNGCDNWSGGRIENLYQTYIDGEKEISEINRISKSPCKRVKIDFKL